MCPAIYSKRPKPVRVSAFFIGSRNFLHSLATIGVKG